MVCQCDNLILACTKYFIIANIYQFINYTCSMFSVAFVVIVSTTNSNISPSKQKVGIAESESEHGDRRWDMELPLFTVWFKMIPVTKHTIGMLCV